jgi:hypothetical protein
LLVLTILSQVGHLEGMGLFMEEPYRRSISAFNAIALTDMPVKRFAVQKSRSALLGLSIRSQGGRRVLFSYEVRTFPSLIHD